MRQVEELLKDGKIKVAIRKSWNLWWWERVNYEKYMLSWDKKLKIKLNTLENPHPNPVHWKGSKDLFPVNWTNEDIALAIKKANKLLETWNNWKLAMNLNETTFLKYAREGWIYNPWNRSYDNLLEKFRNWWEIQFSEFWKNLTRHEYNYNWKNIQIWGKYINWHLVQKVTTLLPKPN